MSSISSYAAHNSDNILMRGLYSATYVVARCASPPEIDEEDI
ncbi:hypothetical protein [Hafnia alvei]|nr:hypothetical protein [Hafnia alvei]